MMNGILTQTTLTSPATAVGGNPGGEGIQFDGDVCTTEDQRLEIIKRKIQEKLFVRLRAQSFSGLLRDRPMAR